MRSDASARRREKHAAGEDSMHLQRKIKEEIGHKKKRRGEKMKKIEVALFSTNVFFFKNEERRRKKRVHPGFRAASDAPLERGSTMELSPHVSRTREWPTRIAQGGIAAVRIAVFVI